MGVTAGKKSDVWITASPSIAFTNEATTADAVRKRYTITAQAKRYWDEDVAVVVETSPNGSDWSPATPDSIEYAGGVIVFDTARPSGTQIRVDGAYFTYSKLIDGREWTLDDAMDMLDATVFGNEEKRFKPTYTGGTIAITRWHQDDYFHDQLGALLAVVLYVNASAQPAGMRHEAFARLSADGLRVARDALNEESLTFTIEGQVYDRAT